MTDRKDRKQASVHPLMVGKEKDGVSPSPAQARDSEVAATDPLLEALRHAAEDMLREPVPDRLLEALGSRSDKKTDR